MFKRKKKDVIEFHQSVTVNDGKAVISVTGGSLPSKTAYVTPGTNGIGATVSIFQHGWRFQADNASLDEARAFRDAINAAIESAVRSEGAVASIYGGK